MSKIFVTGSADGLGLLAAKALVAQGHEVVLHARNHERGQQALKGAPGASAVFTGNLASVAETKALADQLNAWGTFDAVIHNAGVYEARPTDIFPINTLAPYVLTCLMHKPQRLVYLTSGLHQQGKYSFENFKHNGGVSYADSKLHVVMLSLALSRHWPDVYANAVNPGWVPTKMGGANAPDDLQQGYETQVWLATSNDATAKVSGRYFFHQKIKPHNPLADNVNAQEELLRRCGEVTGVDFPGKI